MKETAYLIIHGFGGNLGEIEYLAGYLRAKGLDVHTVLLAGHGKTKRELKKYAYADWLDSVKLAVESLQKEYRRIVFLGFSMGGLLSLHFAGRPESDKLVLVNMPIYIWNIKVILKDVINGIRWREFEKLKYYRKSVLGTSIKSGIDFLKILSRSKKKLEGIERPTLIVQCMDDESVHHRSARYIKNKIGTSAVLRCYDGGCHQVFAEPGEVRELVCGDIYQFLISDPDSPAGDL